jgi:hypothetical protein
MKQGKEKIFSYPVLFVNNGTTPCIVLNSLVKMKIIMSIYLSERMIIDDQQISGKIYSPSVAAAQTRMETYAVFLNP